MDIRGQGGAEYMLLFGAVIIMAVAGLFLYQSFILFIYKIYINIIITWQLLIKR